MANVARKITDRDCLRAAQRALAAHLALRPATSDEALAIAAEHRAEERAHLDYAARLRSTSAPTADERGRGPDALDRQHAASRAVCGALQDAGRVEQLAAKAAARAQAWERVAQGPEGEAYRETERELRERVAYYAGLCGVEVAS